jgi:formylglycine-generating enzyme required for sulfatase activity
MKKATSWLAMSAAALAAALVQAAEASVAPGTMEAKAGGGAPDAADALLGDIAKTEKTETEAEALAAALETAKRYRWDGKESVADYARRVGIKDVQIELDLGSNVTMKLTLIPAGTFTMGAREAEFAEINGVRTMVREPEEGAWATEFPRREVTLSKPFYMGVYEVTQEQYLQIMKKITPFGHKPPPAEGKTLPVHPIGWVDAVEFCKKVSALTGRTVTLPTEAQWEYACRAGTTTRFWFGDDDDELYKYDNYARASQSKEHHDPFDGLAPVGSFKPNPWGLYDMHGNVSEHCSDWMGDDMVSGGKRKESYANAGSLDPTGPKTAPEWYHVWRGGSYASPQYACRSAGTRPYHSGDGCGIRVVVALK